MVNRWMVFRLFGFFVLIMVCFFIVMLLLVR